VSCAPVNLAGREGDFDNTVRCSTAGAARGLHRHALGDRVEMDGAGEGISLGSCYKDRLIDLCRE
jgi:hypothetical protein